MLYPLSYGRCSISLFFTQNVAPDGGSVKHAPVGHRFPPPAIFSVSSFQPMQAVEFHPLATDRWGDFEKLFGKNDACVDCWFIGWRLRRAEWERQKSRMCESERRDLGYGNTARSFATQFSAYEDSSKIIFFGPKGSILNP